MFARAKFSKSTRIHCANHQQTAQMQKENEVTCTTKLPATTGELVLVFHSSGAAAETAGCCTVTLTGCKAALRRDD